MQNHRKISRPHFHLSLLGRTGTWRRKWKRLKAGESNGKLPQERAQDAVCQSHTGHMTGLWNAFFASFCSPVVAGYLQIGYKWKYPYINNRPTRCNTKQSIYYSANSLYMFRVSTTPITRSTQNCNYSLRCTKVAKLALPRCTKNMTSTGGCSYNFVYSWWWVWLTPETCIVNLQSNKWTALCCISLDGY